jgi:F-type H+-transporting ATPase subunit epsilon
MTSTNTFQCAVITPERKVLDTAATFVAFPAHDGEMGVLTRRAPLVCKLGIGVLRIETPAEKHAMFIDGGFAQVLDDRLTILTQQARKTSELNAVAAEQAVVEARAMKITDDASSTARANALQRARIQLKLANQGT